MPKGCLSILMSVMMANVRGSKGIINSLTNTAKLSSQKVVTVVVAIAARVQLPSPLSLENGTQ